MGFTMGGELGRSAKAKGWILHRLEDERDAAAHDPGYVDALEKQIAATKATDAERFAQVTKGNELRMKLILAQRDAGIIDGEEPMRPPLHSSVRDAIDWRPCR